MCLERQQKESEDDLRARNGHSGVLAAMSSAEQLKTDRSITAPQELPHKRALKNEVIDIVCFGYLKPPSYGLIPVGAHCHQRKMTTALALNENELWGIDEKVSVSLEIQNGCLSKETWPRCPS